MRAREFIIEDNPDYDEDRFLKSDPGTPLSFPKGTTLVNVSDVYDWYKLGMAVSDLDDADPRTFNKGVPHTVFAFGSEEEEHKMIPLLKRLGFSLHDIDSPEDYAKAIRADEAIAHLEEMVSQQVINDDENQRAGPMTPIDPVKLAQLNQKINTDQADSNLPSGMDWTQQIGNTGGDAEGWQKAQGRVGDVNIGLDADYNHPQSNFAQQRGINLGYGPASVNIGDRGAVSGSYNVPIDDRSSVSLSASGQKDFGVTGVGAQYQRGGFSAGVNQPNFPGATPSFNVGYSKQFEDAESEVAESTSPSITVKDAKRALLALGFEPTGRGKGSHDVWKDSSGLLFTIPVHGKDLEYGVAKALLKLIRSRQTELDEMAGSIHVGISQALAKKGYQYLGGGIDKQAYLEPNGQVYIVFGYRKGVDDFSPDQRMFINWIDYCNRHQDNPHLPRFSAFETFKFQGKNYIQARMETLQELPKTVGTLVGQIDQVTKQIGQGNFKSAYKKIKSYAEFASAEDYYAPEYNPQYFEDIKEVVDLLGGPERADGLLKTVYEVSRFARKHNFTVDLHSGNYMQRPDGTIVVNDPFVIWERNL
jgi:predicted RNA binding protein YcfA (HicA-like mRNA interferase family)